MSQSSHQPTRSPQLCKTIPTSLSSGPKAYTQLQGVLLDQFGVLHNGKEAYRDAVAAVQRYALLWSTFGAAVRDTCRVEQASVEVHLTRDRLWPTSDRDGLPILTSYVLTLSYYVRLRDSGRKVVVLSNSSRRAVHFLSDSAIACTLCWPTTYSHICVGSCAVTCSAGQIVLLPAALCHMSGQHVDDRL